MRMLSSLQALSLDRVPIRVCLVTFSSAPTDDIHIFSPKDQTMDHISCFGASESLIMDHITCWGMPKEEWAPQPRVEEPCCVLHSPTLSVQTNLARGRFYARGCSKEKS